MAEVKLTTGYFLSTFFRHYQLHQAAASDMAKAARAPVQPTLSTLKRVEVPPATFGVLPPLAIAESEADYFARKQAEEEAAEAAAVAAAEAEKAAARLAAGLGAGEEEQKEEEEEEEAAVEEEQQEEQPEETLEEPAPEVAEGEEGGEEAELTLGEMLANAVNEQMAPIRANMEATLKSKEAAVMARIEELRADAGL